MKTYDKYKPSGIEWIGDIPERWDVKRIKRLSPVKRGASPRPIDDPKYFDDDGEFAWVRIADLTASERYLETTTQRLSKLGSSLSVKRFPGNFFLSIAGTVGKPIITKIKCCIHDGFVWFPDLAINPEYLYYIFCTGLPYQGLGKWGTQLNLNTDTVGEVFIPIPNEDEIEGLVKYLDEQTAQIDKLIAGKRRLIELLKEERLGVINKAVTRGINPHAKLKPSGIDWLGDIPEHWEVKKLKYLARVNPSQSSFDFDKSSLEEVVFLPMERVSEDGKIDQELRKKIVEVTSGFTYFERNDVIIAKITPCFENGKGALLNGLETDFGFGSTEFHTLRASQFIDSMFLFCVTKTEMFMNVGEAFMSGAAGQKRVSTDFVKNFLIGLPPIEEQKQIIQFIEAETNKIDATFSKIEKEIEYLQEYRTALISEVVTGKIKVV